MAETLTPRQIADRYGLAASTVTTWISRGLDGDRLDAVRVPYRKDQSRYVVTADEWARFAAAHAILPRRDDRSRSDDVARPGTHATSADTVALELQLAMLRSSLVEAEAALALARAEAASLRAKLQTVSALAENQSALLARVAKDLAAPDRLHLDAPRARSGHEPHARF